MKFLGIITGDPECLLKVPVLLIVDVGGETIKKKSIRSVHNFQEMIKGLTSILIPKINLDRDSIDCVWLAALPSTTDEPPEDVPIFNFIYNDMDQEAIGHGFHVMKALLSFLGNHTPQVIHLARCRLMIQVGLVEENHAR